MQNKSLVLFLVTIGILQFSCGGGTGTSGASSSASATLSGTVAVPSAASADISVGAFVSKSVSKDIIPGPSLAIAEAAPSGGLVTIQTVEDGTALDTCSVANGSFLDCNFDVNKLGASKQVEVITKVDDKTVTCMGDASSVASGGTLEIGACNSDTSLTVGLVYASIDDNANVENKTDTFKSGIADGTFKPKEVYKADKASMEAGTSGGSAGADNSKNGMFTFGKAIKACMATVPNFKPSDIGSALAGGAILSTCLGKDSSVASVDPSSLATLAKRSGEMAKKFFADNTTAEKWSKGGNDAFKALAETWVTWDPTQLKNGIDNPANARALMNQYADDFAASGSTDAFKKMKEGGPAMGEYMVQFGGTAMDTDQLGAAKKLFDNFDYTGKTAADVLKIGDSAYNQVKACSGTECTNIASNPTKYTGQIVSCPTCLAGTDGLTVAQGRIDFIGTGGSVTDVTACKANADCTGGKTCSTTTGFCIAAGGFGATCATNTDCASSTNNCDATTLKCVFPSGTVVGQAACGAACSTTAGCISGASCTSNICVCTAGTAGNLPSSFTLTSGTITNGCNGGIGNQGVTNRTVTISSQTSTAGTGKSTVSTATDNPLTIVKTSGVATLTSDLVQGSSNGCVYTVKSVLVTPLSPFSCSSHVLTFKEVSGSNCNLVLNSSFTSSGTDLESCTQTFSAPTCTQ